MTDSAGSGSLSSGKPPAWMNAAMRTALRTPGLQSVLGRSIALITVVGRRSGRHYTTPVTYYRSGDTVTIVTKRIRQWWRNLQTNPELQLRLAGTDYRGHAELRVGDVDALEDFCSFLEHNRQDARAYGIRFQDGRVDRDQVRELLPELVVITVTLTARRR